MLFLRQARIERLHCRASLFAGAIMLSAVAGLLVPRNVAGAQLGATRGELTLTPAAPQRGQTVTVRYQPEARLRAYSSLALRGRLRSRNGESYNGGIPVSTLAVLARDARGAFAGSFTLPDSVVYAALAVEDSAGTVIDDNGGRTWEALITSRGGTPEFEALDQRAHDMMGRNWEEGFATVRRMVALYPNEIRGWDWLLAFHGWLGQGKDDSVRALHRAKLAAFDSTLTRADNVSRDDLERIVWYASGIDTTIAARWRTRLFREAPANAYAVQWRLFGILDTLRSRKDTAEAFRRFEDLWVDTPASRTSQVASHVVGIAFRSGDTTLIRRWSNRVVESSRNRRAATRYAAERFTTVPALRTEGMQQLRSELESLAQLPSAERALGESVGEQRKRQAATGRSVLASLGRALVAAGEHVAGLDTLAKAAATGWDLEILQALRTASLAAGDTGRAVDIAARIAVDPRTDSSFVDSVAPIAMRQLGAAEWDSRLAAARAEFVDRMLADAPTKSLAGAVRVRDANGRTHDLRALAKGRVTLVAFWSRFCGWSLEDLPDLNRVAARLAQSGMQVVSIVKEPAPSPELTTFLRDKQVTIPTYFDTWHEASRALNQWGTPSYYMLDAQGRVRFDRSSSANEVLARAEALRLAVPTKTALRSRPDPSHTPP
jgi:hypothetical protein